MSFLRKFFRVVPVDLIAVPCTQCMVFQRQVFTASFRQNIFSAILQVRTAVSSCLCESSLPVSPPDPAIALNNSTKYKGRVRIAVTVQPTRFMLHYNFLTRGRFGSIFQLRWVQNIGFKVLHAFIYQLLCVTRSSAVVEKLRVPSASYCMKTFMSTITPCTTLQTYNYACALNFYLI